MEETLDVEARSHVEMFHHYFFTLAPDDKYIRYTMEKAMLLSGRNGLGTVQYAQGERFLFQHLGNECRLFDFLRQYHLQQGEDGVHLTTGGSVSNGAAIS